MKRLGLVPAVLLVAGLAAQPAAAADFKGPGYAPRHKVYRKAPPHAAPHKYQHKRDWACWGKRENRNCYPTWGWGMRTPTGPLAAVIVARGDVPLMHRHDLPYKRSCHAPRLAWNGFKWVKTWGVEC
jgi:hypothetical protein